MFNATFLESLGSLDDGRQASPTMAAHARIRRPAEFRAVLDEGSRITGPRLVLYLRPSDQGIRVGLVTGRAVGGAVQRNRVRRRLREAWRSVSTLFRPGFDVVIVARPNAAGTNTRTFRDELEALLVSAGADRS